MKKFLLGILIVILAVAGYVWYKFSTAGGGDHHRAIRGDCRAEVVGEDRRGEEGCRQTANRRRVPH